MNRYFRAVYALGLSTVGIAAVVLAISEASDGATHSFADRVQPAMDVAIPSLAAIVLLIAAIGTIALVSWALDTATPRGGR